MKLSQVAILFGLTAISLAEAVPAPSNGKVRYYFPREIKRDIDLFNTTSSSTSSGSDNLANALSSLLGAGATTTPTPTNAASASSASSTGDHLTIGLTSVVNSLANGLTSSSATPAGSDTGPTSTNSVPQGTGDSQSSGATATPTPKGGSHDTPTTTGPASSPTDSSPGGLLNTLTSVLLPSASATDSNPSIITPPSSPTGIVNSVTSYLPSVPTLTNTGVDTSIVTPPSSPTDGASGITGPGTGILTTPTVSNPYSNPGATTTTPGNPYSNPGTTTTTPGNPYSNSGTTPTAGITGPTTGVSNTETTPSGITGPVTGVSNSNTNLPTSPTGTSTSGPAFSAAATQPTSVSTSGTDTGAPQTIKPTATNTDTVLPQASSIVSATPTQATSGAPPTSASTIPSSLPRIIQPNGGVPAAPDNGTLIQLGFTYGLNYPFVVSNSWAVQQIFDYLPPGVAHGVNIDPKQVVMQYLQAYNTLSRNGYITTLAMAYIPDAQVNPLSLALLNPNSALYNNNNQTVKTLMSMIDPSIPLLAGQSIGDGNPINSANSAATTSGGSGEGAAGTDDNSSNSSVKPSSIGIGLGVVCGAAVYGGAMFMVARRYKKRKNAHRRASSVQSGSTGPRETNTLMTGARNSYGSRQPEHINTAGRHSRNSDRSHQSGRTYISAPVMAENSLGWN